jgi:outer membrane protein assembly factor BamA
VFLIDSIILKGNKHTKDYIIINELDFRSGDQIILTEAESIFGKNKDRLLGTGLFVDVKFNISTIDTDRNRVIISILITESWYIYPYPVLELADRNYSEWVYERNAAIKRLNYGISLEHKNLSGNNDNLELKLQTGITKKIELTHARPFISKDYKAGFYFNVLRKTSSEIAYKTVNNKLAYYTEGNKKMFEQFRINSAITFRPSVHYKHIFRLSYFNNKVDTIVSNKLNPDFFLNGAKQKYFTLAYRFMHDKRNYRIYPSKGHLIYFEILKSGLGIYRDINQLSLYLGFQKYIPLWEKTFTSLVFEAKTSLFDNKLPYINNFALGYDNLYLNGYELYVIDGKDFFMLRTSHKYNFMKGLADMSRIISLSQFRQIPYEFYLTLNFDTGYVNNNINFASNDFSNRFLFGYGLGLDFVIYHNILNITYSFNHTGESGLYFLIRKDF